MVLHFIIKKYKRIKKYCHNGLEELKGENVFCMKGDDESRSANLTLTSKEGLGDFLPFHGICVT